MYHNSKIDFIHTEIDKLIPEKQNTNFLYSILKYKKFQISYSQKKVTSSKLARTQSGNVFIPMK